MRKFNDSVLRKLVYLAKCYLVDYDGEGIDEWDSVMFDPLNGWDVNIWQESRDTPLSIVAYEVIDGRIQTEISEDITKNVFND